MEKENNHKMGNSLFNILYKSTTLSNICGTFVPQIAIKLLKCIKKERILKVPRTKVPQLKIFVVLLYQN